MKLYELKDLSKMQDGLWRWILNQDDRELEDDYIEYLLHGWEAGDGKSFRIFRNISELKENIVEYLI